MLRTEYTGPSDHGVLMASAVRHRTALRLAAVAALVAALLAVDGSRAQAIRAPETLADHRPVQAQPVAVDFPIQYLGVIHDVDDPGGGHGHHHPGRSPHGEVRFRHDGTWGPWRQLTPDGAQAPDTWTSGLVRADDADAYQVRGLPEHAADARAVALNTTDGPMQEVGEASRGGAGAIANDRCITRAQWGADEGLRFDDQGNETWPTEFFPAQALTVHHTGGRDDNEAAADDPDGFVRAIYHYHAVDNGWGDIGYQYLIDREGYVYEGRWSGTTSDPCSPTASSLSDVEGAPASGDGDGTDFAHDANGDVVTAAHNAGANSANVGVALLGNFTDHNRFGTAPPTAAVDQLERLLAELAIRHGLDPQGTVAYDNPSPDCSDNGGSYDCFEGEQPTISGHRDWDSTACPGDRLYDQLPQIREDVAALMGSGDDTGQASVTITDPTDGATVSGTVDVAADATADAGVDSVTFTVDNTHLATDSDGSDGWQAPWDTTTTTDGDHTVTAEVTASDGATASDQIAVTVANDSTTTDTVHVGDLDATTSEQGAEWGTTVTVTVHDGAHQPVGGASVVGTWELPDGSRTTDECETGADGTCTVSTSGLHKRDKSVTFTVDDVQHATAYDPSANHDPDGDSDGTTIRVTR